ncbi:hypothetical protein DI270_019995 [Microbispora triticiradicis]|uniref:DUF3040 domain-containing protein n=1 Tax=Microbispora triticiradicis TaxID=2200763 RepID=A0ABX9LHD6_9ACTN|nr:hypothetical protein DI270_019995 [Microbispora triticiradicis]
MLYLAIVVMWLSVLLPMWLRRDRHTDDDLFEDPAAEATTLSERPAASAGPESGPESDLEADPEDGSAPGAEDGVEENDADTVVTPPVRATSSPDSAASASAAPAGSADQATADQVAAERHARARRMAAYRRARILARRRRRLLWSVLLVLASVVTAAVRVMPWWAVAPSGVLLVGYLAMLRVAVRADREQREKAARARAAYLRRQRERRRALAALTREAEIIKFEARKRSQVFDQYADGRRAAGD